MGRGFLVALSMRKPVIKNGPFWGVSMHDERKPGETSGSCLARARCPCVCDAPGYSMLSGNPYHEQCARPRCSDGRAPHLVVPAKEPFPFWQQFGISEPLPRRSSPSINSLVRRILEASRLDFLDHPFAREWHSRANARRRIADHPIAIVVRVAAQEGLASSTGANLNLQR